MCGVQERAVAFVLTDSQIVNEAFLEDISYILNSGEVPGKRALGYALQGSEQAVPCLTCCLIQQHCQVL